MHILKSLKKIICHINVQKICIASNANKSIVQEIWQENDEQFMLEVVRQVVMC